MICGTRANQEQCAKPLNLFSNGGSVQYEVVRVTYAGYEGGPYGGGELELLYRPGRAGRPGVTLREAVRPRQAMRVLIR